MSDALPLPPRPNLDQYRKLAKDLQQACLSGDSGAIRQWAERWVEALTRLQGRETTPEVRKDIDRGVRRIEKHWQELRESKEDNSRCALTGAQFFVAREHGFTSWPKFSKHVAALSSGNSPVSH